MINSGWATLLGFAILAATIAYLGRYEVAAIPGGAALVTDRWLGTVSLCLTIADNVTVSCFPRFPASKLPTWDEAQPNKP